MVPAPITAIVFTSIRCSPIEGESFQKFPVRFFIKTQNHLRSSKDYRPANEIRFLSHEFYGLGARGRMFFHFSRPVNLIPRIPEFFVIAMVDQFLEFSICQPLFILVA